MGLPRWFSRKESACQCRRCRRCGFDLWVRKIPWSRKWQPIPLETSMNRGAWKVTVHGGAKSRTRLSYRAHSIYFIYDKYILKIYLSLPAMQETWVRSPGGGHGNPLQCSCLGHPLDGGAKQATVYGVTKIRRDWVTQHSTAHLSVCFSSPL